MPGASCSSHNGNSSLHNNYNQGNSDRTPNQLPFNDTNNYSFSNCSNNSNVVSIDNSNMVSNSSTITTSNSSSSVSSSNGLTSCSISSSSNNSVSSVGSSCSGSNSSSSVSSSIVPVYKTSTEIIEEIDDQIMRDAQARQRSAGSYTSDVKTCSQSSLASSYSHSSAAPQPSSSIYSNSTPYNNNNNSSSNVNGFLQYNNSRTSYSGSAMQSCSYNGYAATCHHQSTHIHSMADQSLSNSVKSLKEVVYHSILASMDP